MSPPGVTPHHLPSDATNRLLRQQQAYPAFELPVVNFGMCVINQLSLLVYSFYWTCMNTAEAVHLCNAVSLGYFGVNGTNNK